MNGRELKVCGTMEQANLYIRKLVVEDCNRIGINSFDIINEIISRDEHNYIVIQDIEFDEVGGITRDGLYYVCLKSIKAN